MPKVKIITIMLFLLLLGGCQSNYSKAYSENRYQDFTLKIALALDDEIKPSVFIDLRAYGDENDPSTGGYINGHIEYFINYDYSSMGHHEFIKAINYRYLKKTHFFIIDEDGQTVEVVASILKENGYQHIYYYTNGYQSLIELAKDQFPIRTGNCDC